MSAKDCEGHFSGGWGEFYSKNYDVGAGNPHLRTYTGKQAEKFYEAFKQPAPPVRNGKAAVPAFRDASVTWGIGGTLPHGRRVGVLPPAADFKFSCKKYIAPRPSEEQAAGEDLGRKRHVYDERTGVDRAHRRSAGFLLEDQLQRKAAVPEEMRCDQRTIHRMAPPGLKGYMGAEYSNDFFARPPPSPPPVESRGPPRKSFKQKRAEADLEADAELVRRELGTIPMASGDGELLDSDDEGEREEGERVLASD
jgi:hypothetical protein